MTPIEGILALYIFMLATFVGYEIVSKVSVSASIDSHRPLMSGSSLINGIVLVGAILVLGQAETHTELTLGFIAIFLATGNAVGGYLVTKRLIDSFPSSSNSSDQSSNEETGA